ncbi:MAG: hypothetical protein WCI97_12565 [Bacteroidota bacterium]
MNCLKKRLIYSALICNLFFCFGVRAQDIAATFDLANQMKDEGNYDAAIKLYQRVNFFGNGYKSSECLLQTADVYFKLNEYDKAAEYYDYAYSSVHDDSLHNLISLSKAVIFIYQKKYLESLQELFSVTDDEFFMRTKNIYLATTYYGLNKFEECKAVLFELEKDSIEKIQLAKLISKAEKIQKRNPNTAKVLSMIIPGLGQFYAGDIRDGLNSLIISSAFMYLGINTALQYSFIEATSVVPWFARYYMGGYNHAKIIMENRIEEKQFSIYQQILKIIETE